jgi:hypothetical protein
MHVKRYGSKRVFFFVAIVLGVGTALGFAVMHLWNWLMPGVFGLAAIGFWQALGLLVLSRILLGFPGRRGGPMHWRHRMAERWEQMTPEEREKFRSGMRGHCGPFRRRMEEQEG